MRQWIIAAFAAVVMLAFAPSSYASPLVATAGLKGAAARSDVVQVNGYGYEHVHHVYKVRHHRPYWHPHVRPHDGCAYRYCGWRAYHHHHTCWHHHGWRYHHHCGCHHHHHHHHHCGGHHHHHHHGYHHHHHHCGGHHYHPHPIGY